MPPYGFKLTVYKLLYSLSA